MDSFPSKNQTSSCRVALIFQATEVCILSLGRTSHLFSDMDLEQQSSFKTQSNLNYSLSILTTKINSQCSHLCTESTEEGLSLSRIAQEARVKSWSYSNSKCIEFNSCPLAALIENQNASQVFLILISAAQPPTVIFSQNFVLFVQSSAQPSPVS